MTHARDYSTPFSERRRPFSVVAVLGRLLLAAALAVVVVEAGLVGFVSSSSGQLAGMLGSPLVLLLLPGLCSAEFTAEPHTFLRSEVIAVSLGVYFVVFLAGLTVLAARRNDRAAEKIDSRSADSR